MLTHDRPVGRRARRGRAVVRLDRTPPRARRADRASSALTLAAGTGAGALLLLVLVDARHVVDLDLGWPTAALAWSVPAGLGLLALVVPVVAVPARPVHRRRAQPWLLRRRRRRPLDGPRRSPAPTTPRPLPRSRAVALLAAATSVLLLVVAFTV